MNRATWLIVLQGIGVTAQLINAGIGTVTHNSAVVLIVSATVAGYQFILQHLGNKMVPTQDQKQ